MQCWGVDTDNHLGGCHALTALFRPIGRVTFLVPTLCEGMLMRILMSTEIFSGFENPFFACGRVTFFACTKKVTKEMHPDRVGLRLPSQQ